MTTLAHTLAQIRKPDRDVAVATQRLLDVKTKPRGSLGRLEDIACQIAAIRGTTAPGPARKAIVVMAADHGVAAESVSAYPQAVTGQMLLNFASGGAAINVLARSAGARLVVVDMGIASALPGAADVRSHWIAAGTRNFVHGPAMTRAEAVAAIEAGIAIARELAADGITLIGLGEMGKPAPSTTGFLVVGVGAARAVRDQLLARHRVLVRDCTSFGLPEHIRIAARSAPDRERLVAALGQELS